MRWLLRNDECSCQSFPCRSHPHTLLSGTRLGASTPMTALLSCLCSLEAGSCEAACQRVCARDKRTPFGSAMRCQWYASPDLDNFPSRLNLRESAHGISANAWCWSGADAADRPIIILALAAIACICVGLTAELLNHRNPRNGP